MNAKVIETAELEVAFKTDLPVKAEEYKLEIASLREKYGHLTLEDVGDKNTYLAISIARKEVKKVRIGVEKYCSAARETAQSYVKKVIAKEKEIVAEISVIEERLALEEKKYTDELLRIEEEKKRQAQLLINSRIEELLALGMTYENSYTLKIADFRISVQNLDCPESGYNDAKVSISEITEKIRIAKEERERIEREEKQRIESIRLEQEAIAKEQKRIADEQARKEREMAERENKLRKDEDARQKAIQDEINRKEREANEAIEKERREKELEQARKDAAEKALKDKAEKEEADRLAKIEAERLAAEKEAKKLARQPDKKKLLSWIDAIQYQFESTEPDLKASEAKTILGEAGTKLHEVLNQLRGQVNQL